jgi:SAM-dependent methyltransferase
LIVIFSVSIDHPDDAVAVLGAEAFDLVFTGIGALCWLPDIDRWAEAVAGLLRPGGRLFLREGHPMLWALDDVGDDGRLVVAYPYFQRAEPTTWDQGGTYVGEWRLRERPDRLPLTYTLQAVKR